MASPNMFLPIPSVGSTSGPQYAIDINACMSLIDQHDHTPGAGVAIPVEGLNIAADLTFNSNSATDLLTAAFSSQGSMPNGANLLAVVDGDLYFSDGDENAVRITQNGAVVGSPGVITGLTAPASASYNSGTERFIWQSNVNVPADMDFRSAVFRNDVASGFGLLVEAPTLSGNAQITLPLPPSGATKIMAMSTAGVITAPYTIDNSTLEISSNVIREKDGGTTNAKLANMAALTVKANATNSSASPQDIAAASDATVFRRNGTTLDFGQVVTGALADEAVTTAKIANANVTLPKQSGANYQRVTVTDGSRSTVGSTTLASFSFTVLTSNRVTEIGLQSQHNGATSYIQFDDIGNTSSVMEIVINVGGNETRMQAQMVRNASGYTLRLPPSGFSRRYSLAAGTYTIAITAQVAVAGIIDWTSIEAFAHEM